MKLDKSFIFKDIRKELIKSFGEEKASLIWEKASAHLDTLEKQYPDIEKKESVLPSTAIYKAIKDVEPDESLEFIRNYGTTIGLKVGKYLKTITSIPGVPNLIWKKIDVIADKMSSGYQCSNLVVTKDSLKMDVVGCPLYEGAKKIGVPEAAQLFCCMDKVYMNDMKGVAYQRTKSIAEGDECCDYQLKDSRKYE